MKNICTLVVAFLFVNTSIDGQSWSRIAIGPGEQPVDVVATDPSGNLYIAGDFFSMGEAITNVLRYTGGSWIPVGSGIPNASSFSPAILSMCIDGSGNIYATGEFNDASGNEYVAKWDGTAWGHLGPLTGTLGFGTAICTDDSGNVYGAGIIAGDSVFNVYKWNGTSWVELGSGSTALNANSAINTICAGPGGTIYAGGFFYNGPGGTPSCVSMWNGSAWSQLGTPTYPYNPFGITSIITDSIGNVYATHVLEDSISTDSTGWPVCKWDGTSWSILGTGAGSLKSNYPILSLCKDPSGNIYAAGEFCDSFTVYGFAYAYVAKWNGSAWSELGTGSGRLHPYDRIWTICSDPSGNIYAAGDITDDGGNGIVGEWGYFPTAVTSLNPLNEVIVSPNPAHDFISVGINSVTTVGPDYRLYDCAGRLFQSGEIGNTNTNIDISQLPSGLYLLQLGDGSGTYKIIKQ